MTPQEEARMSDTAAASIGLADLMIGSHSHICAFFHNADEDNAELAPRDQATPELYQ